MIDEQKDLICVLMLLIILLLLYIPSNMQTILKQFSDMVFFEGDTVQHPLTVNSPDNFLIFPTVFHENKT